MDIENRTKRVALFWNVEMSFEGILAQHEGMENDDWTIEGYVRRSEWVDVDFKPLTRGAMAESALAAIAAKRAEVVEEFTRKLAQLDEQAANYRAICAPVQP